MLEKDFPGSFRVGMLTTENKVIWDAIHPFEWSTLKVRKLLFFYLLFIDIQMCFFTNISNASS